MAKVLIVDDEPDVLNALARSLRIAGHEVTKANSSADAIEAAREHPFELVVLDYIMPTMSGIELLNKLREVIPSVRSIVVSGKLDAGVAEEDLTTELRDKVEVDVYLHKPVENVKLLENIRVLLDESKEKDWKAIAKRNLYEKKNTKAIRDVERSINARKKK